MSRLAVLESGLRSTVEDQGRSGVARWGVPPGGAFDALALVAANRLVGSSDDAAGLELTLRGPELRYEGDRATCVVLVGADFGAAIVRARRGDTVEAVAPGVVAILEPGDRLRTGFARGGARGWLATRGGIDVPRVLGSRSTCLAARFGGLDGRALRAGDALRLAAATGPAARAPASWPDDPPAAAGEPALLRVLPGPQLKRHGDDALAALEATLWSVDPDSDRSGVRLRPLDASNVDHLQGLPGIAPEGTTLGAIQVTPDGSAIVLGPDRPVTGGYAKPALVIEADIGRVARLAPGDRVRFAHVGLEEACHLARRRRAALPAAATA